MQVFEIADTGRVLPNGRSAERFIASHVSPDEVRSVVVGSLPPAGNPGEMWNGTWIKLAKQGNDVVEASQFKFGKELVDGQLQQVARDMGALGRFRLSSAEDLRRLADTAQQHSPLLGDFFRAFARGSRLTDA